jgi:hypothetical protein
MSQKRRRLKQLKGSQLTPLDWTSGRRWYRAPFSLVSISLARLFRKFRRSQQTTQAVPRAALRRRKI